MWLPQLPERLRWDHNAHYHRWLLRRIPPGADSVLDVGCGSGRLACVLAEHVARVDAVDRSGLMIDQARLRCTDADTVSWIVADVLDPRAPLRSSGYDVVTAVSSLHHMPLAEALERLVQLLRPGGRLAVVGHYRAGRRSDLALELVRLPANAAVGLALALRGRAGKPDDPDMPVLPPTATLSEIRRAVEGTMPGAKLRRGLFWRYLLTWTKPG